MCANKHGYWLKALGIALALLNVVLWFTVPAIRAAVDAHLGRVIVGDNPRIVNGVQELFVYYDPWLARFAFPAAYTLGLVLIAFLAAPGSDERFGWICSLAVAMLLLGFEMVWLFLIAVGVCLRGPNWNIFWPNEEWDPHKIVPLNNVNLSEYFWLSWVGRPLEGMHWGLRELPGFVLVGGYFLAGYGLAAYLCWPIWCRATYARWMAFAFVVQIAALAPIKMLLRWIFNLKYVIFIPEYFINL